MKTKSPNVTTITRDDDDTPEPDGDPPDDLEILFERIQVAKSKDAHKRLTMANRNKEDAFKLAAALIERQNKEAYDAQEMYDRISDNRKTEISNAESYANEAEKLAATRRSKLEADYVNASLIDHLDTEEAKLDADSARAKAIATADEANMNKSVPTSSIFGRLGSIFSPTPAPEINLDDTFNPAPAPEINVNDTPRTEMEKHANKMHDDMMNRPIEEGMNFGEDPLATNPNPSKTEFNFGEKQNTKFNVGSNRNELDKAWNKTFQKNKTVKTTTNPSPVTYNSPLEHTGYFPNVNQKYQSPPYPTVDQIYNSPANPPVIQTNHSSANHPVTQTNHSSAYPTADQTKRSPAFPTADHLAHSPDYNPAYHHAPFPAHDPATRYTRGYLPTTNHVSWNVHHKPPNRSNNGDGTHPETRPTVTHPAQLKTNPPRYAEHSPNIMQSEHPHDIKPSVPHVFSEEEYQQSLRDGINQRTPLNAYRHGGDPNGDLNRAPLSNATKP